MINYDYCITRIESSKGEKIKLIPDQIPKELPCVAYIEGPNASGKSTLLHIIALGLYGLKNPEITRELKEKMENLFSSSHQDLIFKICIENKDKSLKLVAEKNKAKSKQIDVYELINNDEKPKFLTYESFKDKYKLIYDIPFDPTKRLDYLTNEIRIQQSNLAAKIKDLRIYIHEIITEIIKRDKKKLDDRKLQYEEFLKKRDNIKDELPQLRDFLNLLEKSVYYEFYNSYKTKYNDLKKEINRLERDITDKTLKIKKDKNALSYIQLDFRKKLFEFEGLRTELLNLIKLILKKGDYLIEIFNDPIDNTSIIIENGGFPEKLGYGIEQLGKKIIELDKENQNNSVVQELRLYKELVELLSNYKNLKSKLPGDQSIDEFINQINQRIQENHGIIVKMENIRNIKTKLDLFKSNKEYLDKVLLTKIQDLRQEIHEEDQERDTDFKQFTSIEIKNKKEELKKNEKLFEKYETRYNNIGKPKLGEICKIGTGSLKEFKGYSEHQLNDYIEKMNEKIQKKNTEANQLDIHLKIISNEIEELAKIKEHEYQQYKDQLDKLLPIIVDLESKLDKEFRNYLEDIVDITKKISNPKKLSVNQEKYNSAIFHYLGKVLGPLFHIDKKYSVESIDLINGIINTTEDKQIRLRDMGTGQSQSAYLKSLLETTEDKKIIALFDEIAAMDNKSLEPIYEKLITLYKKGILIAAIVVQKADNKVSIRNLVK